MNDSYVYAYFDAQGIPRYIGQGRGKRMFVHLRKKTNVALYEMLSGMQNPIVVKLAENLTREEACKIEMLLIATLRRTFEDGVLFNVTAGGQGLLAPSPETRSKIGRANVGRTLSEEHRRKLSLAAKNRSSEAAANIIAARVGKMAHSEKTKAKMSISRRGLKKSDSHRAALSLAQKGKVGRPISFEQRAKISASLKGKPWSEARRLAQQKAA